MNVFRSRLDGNFRCFLFFFIFQSTLPRHSRFTLVFESSSPTIPSSNCVTCQLAGPIERFSMEQTIWLSQPPTRFCGDLHSGGGTQQGQTTCPRSDAGKGNRESNTIGLALQLTFSWEPCCTFKRTWRRCGIHLYVMPGRILTIKGQVFVFVYPPPTPFLVLPFGNYF